MMDIDEIKNARDLIYHLKGLPYDQARDLIDVAGYTVRIALKDGKTYLLTQDYKPFRINLNIQNGYVAGAYVG